MPDVSTPVAILGLGAVALIAGFFWSIGAWLWGKIVAALGL